MHTAVDLASLGDAFWTWRARTQPVAGDDIPRIERPSNWAPDWSPAGWRHSVWSMLRDFCDAHDLLSFPDWLRRYLYMPLPGYLAPLRGLGVTDDLTSPTRLDQDGLHYIPQPRRICRTSTGPWHGSPHADRARRHALLPAGDLVGASGSTAALLLRLRFERRDWLLRGGDALQAGVFDDAPRSREIIYNFMRLRAVRVNVDVRLALGELTVEAAARELATRVPMDAGTAYDEASFFASSPGQAISYQVGKIQILGFLSDARTVQGANFNLRAFHDALWLNGNVPIALQRWEVLGTRDEIDTLEDR